uniref:Ubiquitin 3 binding protein But2 C-terminal domain-containing protein n=1 Tax=Psilocybe cubensis TaxID=181762 RepID=A0A8H8CK02_PSICU
MSEDTTRSRKAKIGAVYPDARRIVITNETSTIVQFRHIDFGMENCSLSFSIPPLTTSFDPSSIAQNGSVIDIWTLNMSHEISRYIGKSWKFAPLRGSRFGIIHLDHRGSDLVPFLCRSNHFSTFELACSPDSPECHVDFWQDQRAEPKAGLKWPKTLGFYIVQMQTDVTVLS